MATWTTEVVRVAATVGSEELRVIDSGLAGRAVVTRSRFMRIFGGAMRMIVLACRLVHQILRWHPHVVHVASSGSLSLLRDLVVIRLASLMKVPSVFHAHFGRITDIFQRAGWERSLLVKVIRHANRVIVLDSSSSQTLEAEGCQAVVIPNPIQLPRRGDPEMAEHYACFVGWMIPSKGVEDLLAAWGMMDHSDGQGNLWRLRLIGPSDAKYVNYLMANFSFKDVDFIGELEHDATLTQIRASGFLVLPSHTEGFPYVVLEAMALSKAVIATGVGGIPDMLADGCGCLVTVGEPHVLAAQMHSLILDSDLREALGRRAFLRVCQEYQSEVVYEQYSRQWALATKKSL